MKFNTPGKLDEYPQDEILVGDVYPVKGGGKAKTRYWVVVAIAGDWKSVQVLGIDDSGEVVQATSYNTYTLLERQRIGRVEGLEDVCFDIIAI